MKHKTQKQPKPNIARAHHYNCAYVIVMVVLIIFPVIFQTIINHIMLSSGRKRTVTSTLLITLLSTWIWTRSRAPIPLDALHNPPISTPRCTTPPTSKLVKWTSGILCIPTLTANHWQAIWHQKKSWTASKMTLKYFRFPSELDNNQ